MNPRHILLAAERQFRVVRIDFEPGQLTPTFTELQSLEFLEARGSYSDRDTDQAGRFPNHGRNPMSAGQSIDERLPMKNEEHRRAVDWVAGCIETFVMAHPDESWLFAAGPTLHNPVLESLRPSTRETLSESVQKNLIHVPAQELAGHFVARV